MKYYFKVINNNKNMSLYDKILSVYGPPCSKYSKNVSAAFKTFKDVPPHEQSIGKLADLIVEEFSKDAGITCYDSSTYGVALDFSSSPLTDEEKSYVSTRGGDWNMKNFLGKYSSYLNYYYKLHGAPPSDEDSDKFQNEHLHSLRKIFNSFK